MTLVIVLSALLGLAAVLATQLFGRSYCRVRGVEENSATLFVLARPVGILAGGAVWTVVRFMTPDVTSTSVEMSAYLHVLDAYAGSVVILAVLDVVAARWFIDEPSFGEARELYFDHGSCDTSGEDWIDAAVNSEEVDA